ncbi:DUF1990 domain-containing protein [Herbiconiux moechotypicola]|uniref:DUF1990 domain-containing protein n=1 Tax=Herbiconiux moechotypicola TaxID=637393 RepID=A0ABP5QE28_9MICO|nr:DUF1990 domain-containing protein [Herbiconiux moechotypicola]MCS5729867.1 DUF1990 domain-containing protein [Herbiconiux moechotypicola]
MTAGGLADVPLTYAAVGATQAPDLLYFPPKGYRPIERRARLGSGRERFETASARLMAWGVQRGSGIAVDDIQPPAPSTADYAGLVYDADGAPLAPRRTHAEQGYAEDGTPLVSPGTTARLTVRAFGVPFEAPVRVVYTVDEPNRRGFAYGTLPGHPESGEELFSVERLADDSVWVVIRAFSRPSTWFFRLGYPVLRLMQARATRKYLRSLLPGMGSVHRSAAGAAARPVAPGA